MKQLCYRSPQGDRVAQGDQNWQETALRGDYKHL